MAVTWSDCQYKNYEYTSIFAIKCNHSHIKDYEQYYELDGHWAYSNKISKLMVGYEKRYSKQDYEYTESLKHKAQMRKNWKFHNLKIINEVPV